MNATKQKALETALGQIERQFGKGTIQRLGDESARQIDVIPTGSAALDKALGIKGYPRGRVIEIYGPESSGKTTLTLHAIAEAQKIGLQAAFVDAEHALDPEYAARLGVDTDNLLLSQPDSGEDALEVVDMLARSGAVEVIVIDSVAALTPRAELEGDMGDSHMGLQARLMSQALRKLTGTISKTNCTVIFINQIRMKIGVMFGNPETTTGGNALKFYASMRLDVRRTGSVKKGDEILGNETKVKVVKNKMAPPFKVAQFKIMYGEGISKAYEILAEGLENGKIVKSGAWYSVDTQRFQGENNLIAAIKSDPWIEEFVCGTKTEEPVDTPSDAVGQETPDASADTLSSVKPNTQETFSGSPETHPVIAAGLKNGAIVRTGRAWVSVFGASFHGNAKVLERVLADEGFAKRIMEFGK